MTPPRIRPGNPPPVKGRIPAPTPPPEPTLKFSFKLLDLHTKQGKFCTTLCKDGYIVKFLERCRDLSRFTVREFRENKSRALRAHLLTFTDTTEPAGFMMLNEQLRQNEAWQFELTANEHGRIHGLLIDDTFYVVWIDPMHRLYR